MGKIFQEIIPYVTGVLLSAGAAYGADSTLVDVSKGNKDLFNNGYMAELRNRLNDYADSVRAELMVSVARDDSMRGVMKAQTDSMIHSLDHPLGIIGLEKRLEALRGNQEITREMVEKFYPSKNVDSTGVQKVPNFSLKRRVIVF